MLKGLLTGLEFALTHPLRLFLFARVVCPVWGVHWSFAYFLSIGAGTRE